MNDSYGINKRHRVKEVINLGDAGDGQLCHLEENKMKASYRIKERHWVDSYGITKRNRVDNYGIKESHRVKYSYET